MLSATNLGKSRIFFQTFFSRPAFDLRLTRQRHVVQPSTIVILRACAYRRHWFVCMRKFDSPITACALCILSVELFSREHAQNKLPFNKTFISWKAVFMSREKLRNKISKCFKFSRKCVNNSSDTSLQVSYAFRCTVDRVKVESKRHVLELHRKWWNTFSKLSALPPSRACIESQVQFWSYSWLRLQRKRSADSRIFYTYELYSIASKAEQIRIVNS